ncbi:hypothetical protein TRFO_31924 [Tritrichomonas foetus]|uniref:BEACH domain-containing protein n=1 Tax=Tritrichomonas foetus TaxID=1144522 RepID=A0A1J4JUU3_9EUKA|nr:hypothetical protein TRFO_31924 [Tritrichomonas foetus]|eukprot:OHT01294.1 hypothetical protein TRFO_31924 [Tritrichomonas foetus]
MDKSWRRFVHLFQDNDSQEIKDFQSLVSSCQSDDDIIKCFNYFIENFGDVLGSDDVNKQIQSPRLENSICHFVKLFLPYISNNIENIQKKNSFQLLIVFLELNKLDKDVIKSITDLIMILFSKCSDVDEEYLFIEKSLLKKQISQFFFSPYNLPDIFKLTFVSENQKFIYLINETFPEVVLKPQENFSPLFELILSSIESNTINNYYECFDFIGNLHKKLRNLNFIEKFIKVSEKFFLELDSIDFYVNFLGTSKIEYDFFNSLINSPIPKEKLLNSAIVVIKNIKNSQQTNSNKFQWFDFSGFLQRGSEITNENQVFIFDIILTFDESKRFEYFKLITPPWNSNISSKLFLNLIRSLHNFDELAEFFLLKENSQTLFEQSNSDKNIAKAIIYICESVSEKKEAEVIKFILSLSNKENFVATNTLTNILSRAKIENYISSIINFIDKGQIPNQVYRILSGIATSNPAFIDAFIKNGLSILFKTLKSHSSFDFLAALACNGPIKEIDEYIFNNYENSVLKSLDDNQLRNLALGLSHDSASFGVLRIPSIAFFVKVPLKSPFDRYIFGKTINKVAKNNFHLINTEYSMLCSNHITDDSYKRQFIDLHADKSKILNDPKELYLMLKGNNPFNDIYQLHFDMPHAVASISIQPTFGFWFKVRHLLGKTIILKANNNEISYDCDGLRVFGKKPVNCLLNEWHMLTFILQTRNFQLANYVTIVLDGVKVFEKIIQIPNYIELGSEMENNAIWYINSRFLYVEETLSLSEVQKIFSEGIESKSPSYRKIHFNNNPKTNEIYNSILDENKINNEKYSYFCKDGFKLVKYRGIGCYLTQIGHPDFIFLQMLKSQNSEELLWWLKSANLLLLKHQFDLNFYNQAMKYVLIKKNSIFSEECQKFITQKLNVKSFIDVFSDLQVLSIPTFNFDFLARLFSSDFDFEQLFDYVLDAYCILELVDITRSSFEDAIHEYVDAHPHMINKILLTACGLHKIKDNEQYSLSEQSEAPEKIKFLLSTATSNSELFVNNVSFGLALNITSILPVSFKVDFIISLTKFCNEFPNYYDYTSLKQYRAMFIDMYQSEEIWCFLLTLLTKDYFDSCEKYINSKIVRKEVLKVFLDVIASVMGIELRLKSSKEKAQANNRREAVQPDDTNMESVTNNENNIDNNDDADSGCTADIFAKIESETTKNYSDEADHAIENSKDIHVKNTDENITQNASEYFQSNNENELKSFDTDQIKNMFSYRLLALIHGIGIDNDKIVFCTHQIERLCSLGFDKLSRQYLPIEKKNGIFSDGEQPKFTYQLRYDYISEFGSKLQKPTIEYLQKLNNEFVPEKIGLSEDFPFDLSNLKILLNNDLMKIIIQLATNVLINLSKTSMFSRKYFTRLTFLGNDVNANVSIAIHKLMVFNILNSENIFTDEIMNQFFSFLSNRIMEKIYYENEIIKLVKYANKIINPKLKNSKMFILACLLNITNIDDRIELLCILFQNSAFLTLLFEDSFYYTSIIHFLCTVEAIKSSKIDQFIQIIQNKPELLQSSFGQAVSQKRQLIWFASQTDTFSEAKNSLEKAALSNTLSFIQTRNECKPPKYPNYYEFKKNRDYHNFMVRQSLKFQIFYRTNLSNYFLEEVIIHLFRKSKQIELILNPVDKYMLTRAPHPLTVPQKLDPLVFNFSIPLKKVHRHIPLQRSSHSPIFRSLLNEINETKAAAVCLSDWCLPPYCSTISVRQVLENQWGTKSLLNCDFLSTPEVLPCIYSLGTDSIKILMNSSLDESGNVKLPESSDMLCHYEAFEVAPFGLYGQTSLFLNRDVLTINYSDIMLVLKRKYAYNPRIADVFTRSGNHFTIIFACKADRQSFIDKFKLNWVSESQFGIGFSQNLLYNIPLEVVTRKWTKGKISTFDYLLYLNIVSGRSFNDPSQYPVVPWVIGDYSTNEPDIRRDLSNPMGAQSEARKQRFLLTYNETHYHYGTHYSHSAAVLHYMLRVEPFTFFEIHLHNGWDHKDRLFCNISEAWRSASDANQADVKELIPEFYAFPAMFENINKLELGVRTDGLSLEKVTMPVWGQNPLHFIWHMRASLENTDKINEWIDLIFGFKQRGEAAVAAFNCFQPLSYDDAFKKKQVDSNDSFNERAAIDMINNFGQCPAQLFTSPHPPRIANILFQRKNLVTTEARYISTLKNTTKIARNVRIVDYQIFVASDLELFVGKDALPIKLSKEEGKYCLSSDNSLYLTASKYGFARIFDKKSKLISEIITLCENVTALALSSQHNILAIANNKKLNLFDTTSGLFMRRTPENEIFEENIIQILFDEISNIIIVAEKHKLSVFALDLRLIASEKVDNPIKCISVGDSELWCEEPFFLCGHEDGLCDIWTIDVFNYKINNSNLVKTDSSICAITIFANSQAALVFNIDKKLTLVSCCYPKMKLLNRQYYNKCALCKQDDGTRQVCTICGLYVCRACRAQRIPVICKRCTERGLSNSSSIDEFSTPEE